MSMYGKNHYNTVISSQEIKIIGKKEKKNQFLIKKEKALANPSRKPASLYFLKTVKTTAVQRNFE